MKFHILTLFPEMMEMVLKESIIGRAQQGNLIEVEAINIRDYAHNKHRHVDDYPCGVIYKTLGLFPNFLESSS